jgi:hypothetical protein
LWALHLARASLATPLSFSGTFGVRAQVLSILPKLLRGPYAGLFHVVNRGQHETVNTPRASIKLLEETLVRASPLTG